MQEDMLNHTQAVRVIDLYSLLPLNAPLLHQLTFVALNQLDQQDLFC
jgi:hypothetical protein